jgi:Uncharacterized conserved protein
MTMFEERRDELEKKYFHEEELLFKATSRRNRLFGLMIAGKTGRQGDEAAAYAKEFVMKAALTPSGDDGLRKLIVDELAAAGQEIPLAEINRLLGELLVQAMEEIRAE